MSDANRISTIIRAYDAAIIRLYCFLRFQIIRQRFLDEVEQYLPEKGRVVDIGCGFGLFSLYFAGKRRDVQFTGVDRNARRIATAQKAAATLGLANVQYTAADVADHRFTGPFDAAYMLDIIHHIPLSAVVPLITQIRDKLTDGGVLVIKDVNNKPLYKRWFTWWLDKAMDPKTPVHYWSINKLTALLREQGFTVYAHQMVDVLPYPHVIYICWKKRAG